MLAIEGTPASISPRLHSHAPPIAAACAAAHGCSSAQGTLTSCVAKACIARNTCCVSGSLSAQEEFQVDGACASCLAWNPCRFEPPQLVIGATNHADQPIVKARTHPAAEHCAGMAC
jgi:hypothetical protein